jgi:hypothetical protein
MWELYISQHYGPSWPVTGIAIQRKWKNNVPYEEHVSVCMPEIFRIAPHNCLKSMLGSLHFDLKGSNCSGCQITHVCNIL